MSARRFPFAPLPARKRMSYLTVDQMRMLDHWCSALHGSFGEYPYLVGSVTRSPDFRDVDIRIPLPDEVVDALPLNVLDLNMLLSRWGRDVTGLPIDCQVQKLSEFRAENGRAYPRWATRSVRAGGEGTP